MKKHHWELKLNNKFDSIKTNLKKNKTDQTSGTYFKIMMKSYLFFKLYSSLIINIFKWNKLLLMVRFLWNITIFIINYSCSQSFMKVSDCVLPDYSQMNMWIGSSRRPSIDSWLLFIQRRRQAKVILPPCW